MRIVLCFALLLSATARAESPSGNTPGMASTKPNTGVSVAVDGGFMVPYTVTIPGTSVSFEMIPIPGGKTSIGSPEGESGRAEDEGPQREVTIDPMWVSKTEVTWGEYKVFMSLYSIFKEHQREGIRKITDDNRVDAITVPTPLYEPSFTFEFGEEPQQPAVTMTQYSAKQYSKWLSGMTGQQYRLPTEAEWEHAARGGTKTAYSFGDSTDAIDEYVSFAGNNPGGPEKVGSKKPNPFGLHDMHGSVWEWTIDAYTEDGYSSLSEGNLSAIDAIKWPTEAYPRCVRGGGWQDEADRCRSAARMGSQDEDWKDQDPNFPLSPWWYTSDPARSVGMRLVRSVKPLPKEIISKFWELDNGDIEQDVTYRLDEGRGALGLPVPELAQDLTKASQ